MGGLRQGLGSGLDTGRLLGPWLQLERKGRKNALTLSAEREQKEQVVLYLLRSQKGRYRTASNGEQWIDHYCLFHDDGKAKGASFQPDTCAYKCFHGGRYTFEDVLAKCGVLHRVGYKKNSLDPFEQRLQGERAAAKLLAHPAPKPPPPLPDATRVPEPPASSPGLPLPRPRADKARSKEGTSAGQTIAEAQAAKEAVTLTLPARTRYTYYFPESGDVSHYMERIEYEDHKDYIWIHPDGQTKGKPEEMHPIYGDNVITEDSYIVVVEGEKCVDEINRMADSLDAPIYGLSWASGSSSADRYSLVVAQRIAELNPKGVVVWPDNDIPGSQAMNKICIQLRELDISYARIKPKEYGWPLKYDVADYVAAGESLATIISAALATTLVRGIDDFLSDLQVTQDEQVIFPGTRRLRPVKNEYIEVLWSMKFDKLPKTAEMRTIMAAVRKKGERSPTLLSYRTVALEDSFYWRSNNLSQCFKVDATDISNVDDPPSRVVVVHEAQSIYPTDVALDATRQDFVDFCNCFRLSPHDMAMIESWLVCCLCGLQTPIMMMRGEAGSGKTTLAKALIAVVEPIVMELESFSTKNRDERNVVRSLQVAPALLVDNVSTMAFAMEDMLSKLVTGYTVALRPLYSEHSEMVTLRKALIVTTTTYDVFKSDLASRLIVVTPTISDRGNQFKSDRFVHDMIAGRIGTVRGYIFQRCREFYAARSQYAQEESGFRIGDMGWVLRSLGYPVDEIVNQQHSRKAEVLNQNDPLLDAIVEFFQYEGGVSRKITPTLLCDRLRSYMLRAGVDASDCPKPSRTFTRYMEEKRQIFKDFGFDVERFRTDGQRVYEFQKLE